MSQPTEAPFSNWPYFQARLLYCARAKAVTAPKRRETVERRMVIEDDLE
jgi:hypothetical protein